MFMDRQIIIFFMFGWTIPLNSALISKPQHTLEMWCDGYDGQDLSKLYRTGDSERYCHVSAVSKACLTPY